MTTTRGRGGSAPARPEAASSPTWRVPSTVPAASSRSPSLDVLARGADVLALLGRPATRTSRAAVGPLERHDGVGTRGHRGAGHDLTAVPGVSGRWRLAGRDLADDGRWTGRSAVASATSSGRRRSRPSPELSKTAARRRVHVLGRGSPRLHQRLREWAAARWVQHPLEMVLDGHRVVSASATLVRAASRPRTARRRRPRSSTSPTHPDARPKVQSPVDHERLGLAQGRRPLREALVEVLDQLVVLGVEIDERHLLAHLVEDEVADRGRRRRSAAPAGRWSSSPARSGRGPRRSCARPRRPRWQRPSRSRSGSPRTRRVRRVDVSSRCGSAAGRGCRRARRGRAIARRSNHRLLVEEYGCRSRSAERRPGRPSASARSRAARSGRRPCGGRSGRPCGRRRYGARPRSRTAPPTRRTSRRPGRRARRRGCRSWRRTRSGSRRRSAGRAGRSAQRGVEVAVARRTPLERRVARPPDRGEVVDAQLGLLVLQELQRQPSTARSS